MGDFRVVVEACGGHGCERQIKDGGTVYGCRNMSCPDCITREYVEKMQRIGCNVHKAVLTHWPHDFIHPMSSDGKSHYKIENEVRDDLLTKKRSGNF